MLSSARFNHLVRLCGGEELNASNRLPHENTRAASGLQLHPPSDSLPGEGGGALIDLFVMQRRKPPRLPIGEGNENKCSPPLDPRRDAEDESVRCCLMALQGAPSP